MLPPSVEGREPGVYLRSNRPENDLDFLWDKERRKHIEHDRFHLGFFLAGAACGSIATLALTFLFFSGGKFLQPAEHPKPLVEEQMLIPDATTASTATPPPKPVVVEKPKPKVEEPKAETKAEPKKENGGGFFGFFGKPQPKAEQTQTKPEATTQSYQVVAGDTLGGIAYKFYHSADPAYIERIQNANHLESADSLKLGQKIVIPPKNY